MWIMLLAPILVTDIIRSIQNSQGKISYWIGLFDVVVFRVESHAEGRCRHNADELLTIVKRLEKGCRITHSFPLSLQCKVLFLHQP